MPSKTRIALKEASIKTKKAVKQASWQVGKFVLLTACAPCLCVVMLLCNPRSQRHDDRIQPPKKPPMPAPRRRALSIPSSHFQDDQRLLEQPQSNFMTRLPLEIRRMIYAHALGNRSIHVVHMEGQLFTDGCSDPNKCQSKDFVYHPLQPVDVALSLLRTCRLIYSEAIEYLYTSNTFLLRNTYDQYPTVDMLSYFMLPHRLIQIRTMHIEWAIDCLPYQLFFSTPLRREPQEIAWNASWRAIQRLPNLQNLHVVLVAPSGTYLPWQYHDRWKEVGPDLLRSIPKIEARNFVITLPNVVGRRKIKMQSPQCELRMQGECSACWKSRRNLMIV